mgnify:CR=1 FL=1
MKSPQLSPLAKWAIRQSLGTVRGNEMISLIELVINAGEKAATSTSTGNAVTSVQCVYTPTNNNEEKKG